MTYSTNIYLDESSIDNPRNYAMTIGGIFVAREKKPALVKAIKALKSQYHFGTEIKRTTVSVRYLDFYKALVDLFFSYDESLQFHCIVADKRKIKMNLYHHGDKELAFYKFIYHFLKQKVQPNTDYHIYIDQKQRKIKERIEHLDNYLTEHCSIYTPNTNIKQLKEYPSQEQLLIQLADLFIWAVGYQKNNFQTSKAKQELCAYIASKLWQSSLDFCSTKSESKFNIFCIRLV